ncbi:MAG: 2-amino-4-hydroxy-6-hydroxymethyldihydropteridine diphosphokinase [Bacteroidia bacterium]|jgi:2-amino-4-hydroxy-6-hydroxymethyldihydropteridine diphosphokinase
MNTAYLILGSNVGDRFQNLNTATQLINESAGNIRKKSEIYVTAAWGNTGQPDFLNQALLIETPLPASELLSALLTIEQMLGRVRNSVKWAERTIDIDILFYNNDIIDDAQLKVPHPFIQERKFVLVPLSEIAASFVHPKLKKSISQMLSECTDDLETAKLER